MSHSLHSTTSHERGRSTRFRRFGRFATIATLAFGLTLSQTPAFATPEFPHSQQTTEQASKQPVGETLETGGLNLTGSDSTLHQANTETIAPGLNHTSFTREQKTGFQTGHVLNVDLTEASLSLDVVDGGSVSGVSSVSNQIKNEDNVVAAVNGDYFDMNNTGAPIGTNVSASEGIRSIANGSSQALSVHEGTASIGALTSAATATIEGRTYDVPSVNSPTEDRDGIAYYTAAWGTTPISQALSANKRTAVKVIDGAVTEILEASALDSDTNLSEGEGVLVFSGSSSDHVPTVGTNVEISVALDRDVDLAVSGQQVLVRDGRATDAEQATAARTAVGISQDGTQLFVVSIEGRQDDAVGMRLSELSELMVDLGAYQALNLDGGGSTTLHSRNPGDASASPTNRPSDGKERDVANALVFRSTAQAPAETAGVTVNPASDSERTDRVFTGLGRTVIGTATNSSGDPLPADVAISPGDGLELLGTPTQNDRGQTVARVTGTKHGLATVRGESNGGEGELPVRVLGELEHLELSHQRVALENADASASVRVLGIDGDGFRAPIETEDIEVSSNDTIEVTPSGVDTFTVSPNAGSGSGTIHFKVGEKRIDLPVTIGFEDVTISDFSDADSWEFSQARASGSVSPSEGENGENALEISYDFTGSTATRGAYAAPPHPIQVDGQPRSITLSIYGDGNGAWPRIQYLNGAGTRSNLDGGNITWHGWRDVTFPVPDGIEYPITIEMVRLMETRPNASYSGSVKIANLGAVVAPDTDAGEKTEIHDSVVDTARLYEERPQQIAVMSDAQFVARSPQSQNVQGARRALQEIKAASPDAIFIVGDFVDEASPEDFELAKRILDEEIGDEIPVTYAPGNHEIMGGEIDNFVEAFGDTRTSQNLQGTQFLTLNTAQGGLRSSDRDQLPWLEDRLEAAATDEGTTSVVLMWHHPMNDPLPTKLSQMGNRVEAREVQDRLSRFRTETGKSVAVINGHVGVFHASTADGVPAIINGNSGKGPSGTPETGGFVGWSMLTIDPSQGIVGKSPEPEVARNAWLQVQMHPFVDSITLGATTELPSTMTVGDQVSVDASFTQDGKHMPFVWPMSAKWGGDHVEVNNGGSEGNAAVIRVNPATGQLVATQPGTATLTFTINGETASHTVEVVAAPAQDPEEEPEPNPDATPEPQPVPEPTSETSTAPQPGPDTEPTPEPTTGTTTPEQQPTQEPTAGTTTPEQDIAGDPGAGTEQVQEDSPGRAESEKTGTLASTGANLLLVLGAGILLLAGGSLAALSATRRRH
ncbi:phosphodiester glycosidase family protein [Auritidibacter ignavus]|uniref:phosphodiester glycosidase family protein n=1 Tax=Auritidibacter ignavus TaxID=678932 RepID=UPI002FE68FCD